MKHYILVDKKPVVVYIPQDIEKMMAFEKSPDKHIGYTELGDYWVSTVFLPFDHSNIWSKEGGAPVLFETMIFCSNAFISWERWSEHDFEYFQTRCSTYDEAVVMHGQAIRRVKRYYLAKKADALLKVGAMAIATILLFYISIFI